MKSFTLEITIHIRFNKKNIPLCTISVVEVPKSVSDDIHGGNMNFICEDVVTLKFYHHLSQLTTRIIEFVKIKVQE